MTPPASSFYSMRRAAIGLAVTVALAACSPSEEATTSTSAPQESTTSSDVVTTSAPTTTLAITTTTTMSPTTTTTESTTTTVDEGDWADQPLVVAAFGALGWWDGSDWVDAQSEGELPVFGGETYQIAVLGLEATTTGGSQTQICEPVLNIGVELDNSDVLGDWPGPYGVAISAPWDLTPHLVDQFEDDGTYAAFASALLAERGLNVPDPIIKQLIRADLEGDGTNEVLVVAEDLAGGFLPQVGDYSIAFMRKVIEGEVATAIIGDSVITDAGEGAFVIGFSIGAVADLNGDSRMEIVSNAAYFEGIGVEVWEYVDDDIGLFKYLEVGCGS